VFHCGFNESAYQLVYVPLADGAMRRMAIVAVPDSVALTALGANAVNHFHHAPMIAVDSSDRIFTNRRHSDFLPKIQPVSIIPGRVATTTKRGICREYSS
jgi:hypothetical protein